MSPRRNIAHALAPPLNDQTIAESQEPEGRRWAATRVGDVNVQFPDNLLWKRRHLELDSHGYIVLEPARSDSAARRAVAVKRYHVSEFCAPYVPDQDREELPHSVILDFMDASTLQVAAENAQAQAGVLQGMWSGWRHCRSVLTPARSPAPGPPVLRPAPIALRRPSLLLLFLPKYPAPRPKGFPLLTTLYHHHHNRRCSPGILHSVAS